MIYFVLGPGRCGSSAVARVLHTEFNISMGTRFRKADKNNLDGYWEDLDFCDLNRYMLAGRITFPEWQIKVGNLIHHRSKNKKAWGLKDPRLCYLFGHYLMLIDDFVLIRCKRDIKEVINSMCRCYGWSFKNAEKVSNERERYLDRILKPFNCIEINFNEQRTSEYIKNIIVKGGIIS